MRLSFLLVLPFWILLAACSHLPHQNGPSAASSPVAVSTADAARVPESVSDPATVAPTPQTIMPELPKQALSEEMLYRFLLGEVAAQRGHGELAAQAYIELARQSRDPRVAHRAAQLAIEAHSYVHALEALDLWLKMEPRATQAAQMRLSLLLSGGRYEEAAAALRALLQADATQAGRVLLQLHGVLQRLQDKGRALEWLLPMVAEFPQLAEGHWLAAQLASELKQIELARGEARRAVELRPDWDLAVALEAQLWMGEDAARALDLLKQYLAAYPNKRDLRLYYARALLEQKQYAASREQFLLLLQSAPDNAEFAFAVALLSLQLGEYARAERELQELLAYSNKDADTVHFYLAQLHEARKEVQGALEHYRQVRNGEHVFAARLREAQLLSQDGQLEAARAVLHQTPATQPAQRMALIVEEARMLRDAGQHHAVFELLIGALEQFPQQPQLLFEAALAADKLKRYDDFERLIRRLMEVAPDSAHAYNALGYSLLERNIRIEEGMRLVQKALQLAPDDAAIIDSVGWGYFRLGDLDHSLEYLRRAYAMNPDPEIAAHLGEVLCLSGSREEGLQLLREALRAHPEHELVQNVLRKYAP